MAHIRVTTETLQNAVADAVKDALGPKYDLPITMPPQLRWPLDYTTNSSEWIFRLTDPEKSKVEAIWWLHLKDGIQAPALEIGKWLLRIHTPLHRILQIRDLLTSPEFLENLPNELRHTLPLFGEWKLRDNLAHSYYSLVCRVLLEQDPRLREERKKELQYILRACTGFAELNQDETFAAISGACQALSEVPEQLHNMCGASAIVRTFDLVLDKDSLELDEAQQASLARLLQMIRVQNALYGDAAPPGIRLEDSRDLWGERSSGKLLRVESWEPDQVRAALGDTPFIGRIKEWSDVRTSIRAATCEDWLKPLISVVEQSSKEDTQKVVEQMLGVSFAPLLSSQAVHETASAQVFIAFPKSTDSSTSKMDQVIYRYQKKLEPIAILFATRLSQRFVRDEKIAEFKNEESRAVAAEQLISGTAHSLKIPLAVVLGALRNDVEKAEWFLTRGMSLVTIGGFIHNRERFIREAEDPKQARIDLETYWVPVSADVDDMYSLILDEKKLREYFDAARYYIRASDSGGSGHDQTPAIKAMTTLVEDETRLRIKCNRRYRLMQMNDPLNEVGVGKRAERYLRYFWSYSRIH